MPVTPSVRKEIFAAIREEMLSLVPPLEIQVDKPAEFTIRGNIPVPYGSRRKIIPGMYFASLVARPNAVSFYFFPIYFKHEAFQKAAPASMKLLKGKTCFIYKKSEQVVPKELKKLLQLGLKAWKKEKYVV